jgi:hypothetical protein
MRDDVSPRAKNGESERRSERRPELAKLPILTRLTRKLQVPSEPATMMETKLPALRPATVTRKSRGSAMRRLYLSTFMIGMFLGMLTGCQNFLCHTAGICDCDNDDDPCTHRAPWAHQAAPPAGAIINNGGVNAQPVSRTLR